MTVSDTAKSIWRAGVNAVKSDQLLNQTVRCDSSSLTVAGQSFDLATLSHIEILGCGKAGRGMALGLVRALNSLPESTSVSGWLNVPADCSEPLVTEFSEDDRSRQLAEAVHLCAARPAGINEPTSACLVGTQEILNRVSRQSSQGLTLFLVSGGGSALLESPVDGIGLDDILKVTRFLAKSGATIQELNTVRTMLSRVKGGGLLRHFSEGRVCSLIVSDIIADPLPLIASGPTVASDVTAEDARRVLLKYAADESELPAEVWEVLNSQTPQSPIKVSYANHLIGTNAVARLASIAEAQRLGFQVVDLGSENCGEAADFGRSIARHLHSLMPDAASQKLKGVCLIAGGETTVSMAPKVAHGQGGRNQEAAVAALACFPDATAWQGKALICAGTDGEDGPTDAAGGLIDEHVAVQAKHSGLNIQQHLESHDAYPLLDSVDGLFRTGPTHTNVMDLAVGLVSYDECL